MKHSPGPWRYERRLGGDGYKSVMDAAGRCVIPPETPVYPNDGRLIAAAPELLELLQRVEWVGDWQNNRVIPRCYFCAGARPLTAAQRHGLEEPALVGHGPECPYSKLLARINGETI